MHCPKLSRFFPYLSLIYWQAIHKTRRDPRSRAKLTLKNRIPRYMKTKNEIAFDSITVKYIGASNCRGSRIKVTSQRGSKTYPYPHELSGSAVYAYAAGLYLESIKKDDLKQYGENAEGWGELSDFSHGVLPSGEHVFVRG